MSFPHIDDALVVCRRHLSGLDDTLPDSVEIESLLVSSIVLLIVSHYENHIAEQFAERAARSGDPYVSNFVRHHTARRFSESRHRKDHRRARRIRNGLP